MATLRFCAYQYQHLPLDVLTERWREAERLAFDVVWNCDTVVEPDRPRHAMFDGPTTLALMARETSEIRVGTLVLEPLLPTTGHTRQGHHDPGPADRRSRRARARRRRPFGGRATGRCHLVPREQVARFREFVELVDLLLRQEVTSYDGVYYRCADAEVIPGPVQRPRPPITIAAHGPRMLAIAARFGDGWSSWGGYGVETEADFYKVSRRAVRAFRRAGGRQGRAPETLRHSLVCFSPLTPWESTGYFTDMVGRFRELGIDEFVLYCRGHGAPMLDTSGRSSSRSPAT